MSSLEFIYDGLSKDILPVRYDINISTNFKTFKYNGKENISIEIKSPTKEISIHSWQIKIKSAYIVSKNKKIKVYKILNDEKNKVAHLIFKEEISGKCNLLINFEGINNDKMYGFYKSSYLDNGKLEYMLSSQFEPNSARSSFPCFDAPIFKSQFKISLEVDEEYDAISNMPIESTKHVKSSNRKIVSFELTPRMSTYLVFLGVGKFEYLKANLGKLKLRVITTQGKSKDGKFALECAKKSISFYEKYFGFKYPLNKVDLIAVPDFAAGAMENWGAITFREASLLVNEKTTPESAKHNVADTIAHELAHQWFGDLVTMEWWDDLWLNESFATFMSYKALKNIYPLWKIENDYYESTISALLGDSLKSTHPISTLIKESGEADSIFDVISYNKGGALLNMINDFVGDKVFSKGLNIYLKTYKYKNAKKEDLWNSIQKASILDPALKGAKIGKILEDWINSEGYPQLEVKMSKKAIWISQSRFRLSKSQNSNSNIWIIPIKYLLDGKESRLILESRSLKINERTFNHILFNPSQSGFYVVKYPKDYIKSTLLYVDKVNLPDLSKAGLLFNLYLLYRSGYISINDYLDYIKASIGNIHYLSTKIILSNLYRIYLIARGNGISKKLRNTIISISKKAIKDVGLVTKKGEPLQNKELRASALMNLALLKDKQISSELFRLFEKNKENTYSIDSNIREAVYVNLSINGGKSEFKELERLYKDASPSEKPLIISAMGSFDKPGMVKYALDYSISGSIKMQDSYRLIRSVNRIRGNYRVYWEWVKDNWDKLKDLYDPSTLMLGDFVSELSIVNDTEVKSDISKFFKKKGVLRQDVEKDYKKAEEMIDNNISLSKYLG